MAATEEKKIDFEDIRNEIEIKFIDTELKVLTIIDFDFDCEFNTPFGFIKLFLQSHFNSLTKIMSAEDRQNFGKLYQKFDDTVKKWTLDNLYYSGTDIYLFYPAEILAAVAIYSGNIKCTKEYSPRDFGFDNYLTADRPFPLGEKDGHNEWLSEVLEDYLRFCDLSPADYFVCIEDVYNALNNIN